MFITNRKCLLCDGGLSPGSCCEITELDWHLYIQEDCRSGFELKKNFKPMPVSDILTGKTRKVQLKLGTKIIKFFLLKVCSLKNGLNPFVQSSHSCLH